MQFRSKTSSRWWKEQSNVASDYSLAASRYAERLAGLVEAGIDYESATLAADAPEPQVITIVMYSFAVYFLVKHWRFGDELKAWHNKRWSMNDIPFKVHAGIIMPCFIEDRTTHHYVTIVCAYCDFAKLDHRELKRLVAKTLFEMKHPKDYRA